MTIEEHFNMLSRGISVALQCLFFLLIAALLMVFSPLLVPLWVVGLLTKNVSFFDAPNSDHYYDDDF